MLYQGSIVKVSLVLSIIFCLTLSGCATTVSSIKEDVDIPLGADSGYLLVGVELTNSIQSIEVSGPRNIRLSRENLEPGSSYFLIEMPAGNYQFDLIRFNRVSRMELKEGYWDFEVMPNEISYVGHLEVMQVGWFFSLSSIELENRSSDALSFLQESFPNILASRKVRYRGPGYDGFLEYVEQKFAKEGAL
jgi:hypothetical protein